MTDLLFVVVTLAAFAALALLAGVLDRGEQRSTESTDR